MKTRDDDRNIAIAWYRPEQWALLRAKAADRHIIEDTFAEWLQVALNAERDLRNRGIAVSRLECDVLEMVEWCARNGRPFDSAGRSAYVADALSRQSFFSEDRDRPLRCRDRRDPRRTQRSSSVRNADAAPARRDRLRHDRAPPGRTHRPRAGISP